MSLNGRRDSGKILTMIAAGMNPAGQISYIAGIVEIEDGHVIRIHQSEIQFVDNKLAEYDFTETALKGAEQ